MKRPRLRAPLHVPFRNEPAHTAGLEVAVRQPTDGDSDPSVIVFLQSSQDRRGSGVGTRILAHMHEGEERTLQLGGGHYYRVTLVAIGAPLGQLIVGHERVRPHLDLDHHPGCPKCAKTLPGTAGRAMTFARARRRLLTRQVGQ